MRETEGHVRIGAAWRLPVRRSVIRGGVICAQQLRGLAVHGSQRVFVGCLG
jgi:hypothetical protein